MQYYLEETLFKVFCLIIIKKIIKELFAGYKFDNNPESPTISLKKTSTKLTKTSDSRSNSPSHIKTNHVNASSLSLNSNHVPQEYNHQVSEFK